MAKIINGNLHGRINIQDITDFERVNNVHLPNDYIDFLKTYNGGEPIPNMNSVAKSDVQWIYGMVVEPFYASLFQHIECFCSRIPSWYIPIANDSGGNLYIMSLYPDNHGLIAFWNHEDEAPDGEADQYFDNLTYVASSFTEFLEQLAAD